MTAKRSSPDEFGFTTLNIESYITRGPVFNTYLIKQLLFAENVNTKNPYPHITPDQAETLREINASDEQWLQADVREKERVNRLMVNYKQDSTKVNVMVMGTIGAGKSATANMLLGRREFTEGNSSEPVTERFATAKMDMLSLTVVDSPGCWNVGMNPDIDFYILVINLACPYFDSNTHQYLRKLPGGDGKGLLSSGRCMAVLTHADTTLSDYTLDTYLEQLKGEPLYCFLIGDMRDRYLAVNNASNSDYEREMTHKALVGGIMKTMGTMLSQKEGETRSLLASLKQALTKRFTKSTFSGIEMPIAAFGSADAKIV